MQLAGIYKITNIVNGKMYIGQSLDVKHRIRQHRYQLNKGIHSNSHLLSSYNIHGVECFSYEIIYTIGDKTITKEQIIKILNDKEKYYIEKYDSFDMGYNLTSGGENKIFSETSIKKMSESHKGQIPSAVTRERISNRLKNRTFSKEHRRKLSEANNGRKHTDSAKQKMSENRMGDKNNRYGTHHTEETKRKIGGAQIGESNHNFGKITPENVKQKCRDSYHGTQCHLAKLDDDKVIAIKIALSEGRSGVSLAEEYGVASTQISSIKHGRTWRHIT